MSVGFNFVVTLDKQGKITDYQKSYNDNYAKIVKVFFPLCFNNKDITANATMITAINNLPMSKETYVTTGIKVMSDLNCYTFDVSNLYEKYKNDDKIGLSKVCYSCSSFDFDSEAFRV